MSSQPIPILKSGLEQELNDRPSNIFNLETLIDFDNVTAEDLEALTKKSLEIGGEIARNQLSTQSHVVSLCGRNRKGTFTVLKNGKLDVNDIRGGQFFVPTDLRLIRITDSSLGRRSEDRPFGPCPFVITEIDHTTVIDFDCEVTQLTITKSRNLVIRMKKAPIAGIECIDSNNIIVDAEKCNFVRATTSSDVKINGRCDDTVLLDMRNCVDVFVNNQQIDVGFFSEGRFSFSPHEKSFVPLSASDDLLGSSAPGSSRMPNLTLLKNMKTGKYTDT